MNTAPLALSPRHDRFVAEFLRDGNATRAYIRAGYAPRGAQPSSARLMRRPDVAAAIAAGRQRLGRAAELSVERIAHEYARIAFASVDDFMVEGEDGRLRVDLDKASAAQRTAIVEIRIRSNHSKQEQEVTLKLGKMQALAALTKQAGLLVEPPEPGLTPEDRDRLQRHNAQLQQALTQSIQEQGRLERELRAASCHSERSEESRPSEIPRSARDDRGATGSASAPHPDRNATGSAHAPDPHRDATGSASAPDPHRDATGSAHAPDFDHNYHPEHREGSRAVEIPRSARDDRGATGSASAPDPHRDATGSAHGPDLDHNCHPEHREGSRAVEIPRSARDDRGATGSASAPNLHRDAAGPSLACDPQYARYLPPRVTTAPPNHVPGLYPETKFVWSGGRALNMGLDSAEALRRAPRGGFPGW